MSPRLRWGYDDAPPPAAAPMSPCPVLLLHPFALDRRCWQPQVEQLRRQQPARAVVAPDLRGFGARQLGPCFESIRVHARDLLDLLDRLALVRVLVVGPSLGRALGT